MSPENIPNLDDYITFLAKHPKINYPSISGITNEKHYFISLPPLAFEHLYPFIKFTKNPPIQEKTKIKTNSIFELKLPKSI